MLRWRLISAAVIIAALTLLVTLDFRQAVWGLTGIWLLPILAAVSLLGTEEVLSLLGRPRRPVAWVIYVGNLAIVLAACGPVWGDLLGRELPAGSLGRDGWPMIALVLAVIGVLVVEMHRYERPGEAVQTLALGIFALVYMGLLFSFLPLLRLWRDNAWGMLAMLSVIVITKLADTGAYACGRTFGRHKMTPLLSPGKTWEGAIGGIAFACLGAWGWFQFAGPWLVGSSYQPPALWATELYGLILAIAGMIGDLAESLLKRDSQRKDSSTWLPGLGGVLDIIDSLLVAAPCAYICWSVGMLG
ncbi:MAG: phosphatidate cytidylyltransferase [Pirellulaceae bacterium]|nr:phosphatidate cytidylyltransferase [Pirellulaceae bacterium]